MSATATVNAGVRKAILAAADSPRVGRFVRRHGMRLGAARFVAGETFEEAIPVLRGLNERGLRANTTLLGEGVRDRLRVARHPEDPVDPTHVDAREERLEVEPHHDRLTVMLSGTCPG